MPERARVLLVGVGGLGCPAALALARAGVATLGIADDDEVDHSNLHRQVLFTEQDIGRPKADVARERLQAMAPSLEVVVHGTRLLPSNAAALCAAYDVVVEGSDNFPTKFLTSDACIVARRPVVHGAAVRWHGTVLAASAGGGPCYRCLFEDVPAEHVPGCSEAGVMAPVLGVLGAVMADLALGLVSSEARSAGTLVTFDGLALEARRRVTSARRDCPSCGVARALPDLDPARYVAARCEVGP